MNDRQIVQLSPYAREGDFVNLHLQVPLLLISHVAELGIYIRVPLPDREHPVAQSTELCYEES